MRFIATAAIVTAALSLSLPARAQSADTSGAINLPPACQAAAQANGQSDMLRRMQSQMSQSMQSGMQAMGQMTDTQKGLQEAMMGMEGPMMQGMMAKDPDTAWICAMIPHHQGAIAMAKAGLRNAKDSESKKLAEETIKENEKGLKKLVDWADKHAARGGETTGRSAPGK